MHINIKATDVTLTSSLRDYAEKKITAAERLLKGDEMIICDVELAQNHAHQTGQLCYAEVTMEIDGTVYRATADAETLEAAIDVVKDELIREITRTRKKQRDLMKRGGKRAKELLRAAR